MIRIYWCYGDVLCWYMDGTSSVILSRLQVVMNKVTRLFPSGCVRMYRQTLDQGLLP